MGQYPNDPVHHQDKIHLLVKKFTYETLDNPCSSARRHSNPVTRF